MINGEMVRKRLEEGGNDNGRGGGQVFEMSKGKTQPTGNPP